MHIITMSELQGMRVLQPRPEGAKGRDGRPKPDRRLGKVGQLVFSPDGTHVVGILVRRPDVAGMIKRADVFCSLDGIERMGEGYLVVSREADRFDAAARRRLGIDWDRCILWAGMDVRTVSGKKLGFVSDVRFDLEEGRVAFLGVGEGSFSSSVLGLLEIPSGMLLGYDPAGDGSLVVKDAAASLALSGGVAAKAGEATARLKERGREAQERAGEALDKAARRAGEAYESGTREVGRLAGRIRDAYREGAQNPPETPEVEGVDVEVSPPDPRRDRGAAQDPAPEAAPASGVDRAADAVGRQLGRTRGMFRAFKDEFDKASR